MVAAVAPSGAVMEVAKIERRLKLAGCEKVGPCTARTCIWRAPNGRHFSAPNPDTMYLVPTRAQERLITLLGVLEHLKPPPTAGT